MRKFLSSMAGASFNQELPTQTVCVRKDCVELIYKVKPSVYVIVSMLHVGDFDVADHDKKTLLTGVDELRFRYSMESKDRMRFFSHLVIFSKVNLAYLRIFV